MNKTAELVRLDEINSNHLFYSLSGEWLSLFNRCSDASPFQSPDWLIPWWKYFGAGKLFTLTLRNEDRLTGLAPLYIHNLSDANTWQATLIGTGNTDYLDILAEKEYSDAIHEEVMSFLYEHSREWDICYFTGLKKTSGLLKAAQSTGFNFYIEENNVSPIIQLPDSFELYCKMLPVSFRKNTKRACNNLIKAGGLRLEKAEENSLAEFIDDVLFLHEKSWAARKGQGVLRGTEIKSFLMDVSRNFLKNNILMLYRLRYNERTIAAVYSMLRSGTLYYYIGGFEPEMKKYSPGSVIIYMIIEELINKGIKRFDFLSGSEPYKYNWAAKDEKTFRLTITKQIK